MAQHFWELTRGNVLFLRHLVQQELAEERLCCVGGVWTWAEGRLRLTTLGQLIDAQMGALSESVADVVDLLAVAEPLDLAVLTDMADPTAFDAALAKGLVTVDYERKRTTARLAHPLYGEVRRARAGIARLRRLRAQVLRALADSPAFDAREVIHRAVLMLDSDLPPDGSLLLRAAGAAMQLLDPSGRASHETPGPSRALGGGAGGGGGDGRAKHNALPPGSNSRSTRDS
jgi:hypothetical protein